MSKYNELSLDEKIIQIGEWISNSKHLVAFTGAGISTESGMSKMGRYFIAGYWIIFTM